MLALLLAAASPTAMAQTAAQRPARPRPAPARPAQPADDQDDTPATVSELVVTGGPEPGPVEVWGASSVNRSVTVETP